MAEDDFPDVEGGVRDYLRGHASVSALVGTRVFFGMPDKPTFPLLVVQRVGGADDPSEAAIDQAVVQIDCWGRLYADSNPGSVGGDKAGCDELRRAVRRALRDIRTATALNSDVVAYGARVESDPFRPDPDSARPRYAITASVMARAA